MKRKKLLFSLAFIFGIFLALNLSPAIAQTNLTPKPGGSVQMDGDNLVWMSWIDDNWEVYYLNRDAGESKNISEDTHNQANPDIWDHYIVWQDDRNHADSIGIFDIYLYDLNSGISKKISQTEGNHQDPVITENKIVWTDRKNGRTDVILYDLETEEQTKVISSTTAYGIKFDGQVIAWTDFRDTQADIYSYDLANQEEIQLSFSDKDEMNPLVGGRQIIWTEEHNGDTHIQSYNPGDGIFRRVTAGSGEHHPIAFDGKTLLLEENGKLFLNKNPTAAVQEPIALINNSPDQIILQGEKILTLSESGLEEEPLTAALTRGQEEEGQPEITPTANPNDTSSNRKGFDTQRENTVTSFDNQLKLTIAPATFTSDFELTIKEDFTDAPEGYNLIAPLYRFEINNEDMPDKKILLTLNYTTADHAGIDQRKIGLYQKLSDGKWGYLPAKHNPGQQTVQAEISSLESVTLMIRQTEFSDLKKHWAQEAVEIVAAHGALNGYPDGSFKPDKPITRAEFTKLIVLIAGEDITDLAQISFVDLSQNHWAYDYIQTAANHGWVRGYQNRFNPDDPITREEMVTILMRALQDNLNTDGTTIDLGQFDDSKTVSSWAEEYLALAVKEELIQGFENKLNAQEKTTRAQAATVFYRYLDKIERF